MAQERRDNVRSPTELTRGRSPVLEPLRTLITNLGPPPLAVTWNRPQIAANDPSAYSRFQHFMFRNAFRGTESFLTSRVVYDGGESKDGLSIICIILRHIDQGSLEYDTLLYCYLKVCPRFSPVSSSLNNASLPWGVITNNMVDCQSLMAQTLRTPYRRNLLLWE